MVSSFSDGPPGHAEIQMTIRTASCRCGRLRATATGEPVRVSVCHCLNCQKRSGSAFAVQARWPAVHVAIEGQSKSFVIPSDSGNRASFHFCPDCGSDVFYTIAGNPMFADLIAIPVGAFADPNFPAPRFSVWEKRKHKWVEITGDRVEHFD